MPTSATLREVSGLPTAPAGFGASALIVIDAQNTYRTGPMALEGVDAALAETARLLDRARAAGAPVIHVVHDGGAGSPYDLTAESGRICAAVAPLEGERVVVKNFPNSFHRTDLAEALEGLGRQDLVLAGFMTHMCVNYTAQGAFNRGYRSTVVAAATATRTLAAPDGAPLPAADLQRAALTGIGDLFALVVPDADAVPE
ncbi:cysteine hydrolase family protein [Actinomadura parmotrematis]|uniref:Cysteine hydrolase n=1 Tax=Actinomadura parmotrematis TaxID=2864039 RepID=A0ABS7G287_9ACTN|nr:cysteine hydrolase family protein [Actinomadura parmotrematis]MBW8486831.1 cysteine hydrolase [Actinomadura parmotrematis]